MSFSRTLFPFIALATTLNVQAQTGGAASASSTRDDPVILENMIVSAVPGERDQTSLASPTSVLLGQALASRMQPSLGETLSGQPGVASSYFGPGASRPVIRGLGGDRVQVLENGVGSIDVSVTSPDHAVSLDPLLVERIEVVRGPAALMYGGSAVGGVVNVIDHRIHRVLPANPVQLSTTARASSVDDGRSATLIVDGGSGSLAWHTDAYRRTAHDVRIPGYAETAAIRSGADEHAAEHGEAAPGHARGTIPNTALQADGAAGGFSWIGKRGFLGVVASGHNTLFGIPSGGHSHDEDAAGGETEEAGEAGVRSDLKQRRIDVQGCLKMPESIFHEANFKLGMARYRHQELEGGEIGTIFRNRGHDGRAELLHKPLGVFSGAIGAQLSHNDLSAHGAEAFLPPSHTANQGLFIFEGADLAPVSWQFGGRFDAQDIQLRDGSGTGRNDHSISLSSGLVWTLGKAWSVSASVARSERAPNVQELFSNGPHAGTQAYEVGDHSLAREKSLAVDLSLRRRAGFVTGEFTVFAHRFDGYIFEGPTGARQDDLDVYRYGQTNADFVGAEVEALLHLHQSERHALDLRLAADCVRAEIRQTGKPLPRITPARVTAGLAYRGPVFGAGCSVQGVDRARRLASNETPTASHILVGADASWSFSAGRRFSGRLFVTASNLLDEEARNHVSFLKDVAPLPGRNLSAGIALSY